MTIQLLHKKLIKKKLTISVAESCTGGLLAHNLTKLANSSKYLFELARPKRSLGWRVEQQ